MSAAAANALLATAAQAAGPRKGGTLKIGLQGGAATDSLDPALAANQVTFHVNRMWGEELVKLSPTGQLLPYLATEWRSSPDAKAWVFKIRKGVQFHNGKEMTADDVVATMQRHSGPNTKSGALGIMRGVDSVTRDGDTVIFTLKDASADFPFLLTDYHLLIQPGGGNDNPKAAIGTGPYKIATFEPGVRVIGERFKNYWAANTRGHAEQVELTVLNDSTARTAALQSGRVNIINRIDPKVVDLIKRAPGVTIQSASGRGHYVFIAHCNTAPFNNLDLRLALKFAMDRKEMVDKLLRGFGSIGNDFPINASYPLFSELPQRPFDTDKAAFHYKKSGHNEPDPAAHLRGRLPRRRRCRPALPGHLCQGRHQDRGQARAGRRLLVQRLEQAAVLHLLLGRPRGAGPDVVHRLHHRRRLERHPLLQPGLRQDGGCGPRRAEPGQAQADVPGHGHDRAQRRRRDRPDVQRHHRRHRPEGRRLGQEPEAPS